MVGAHTFIVQKSGSNTGRRGWRDDDDVGAILGKKKAIAHPGRPVGQALFMF